MTFEAEPARVLDAPTQEHHPFEYFANCPTCAAECAQVYWERSLLKAYVNATGPRTAEGKAATAANLEGHPTKDEALRTRYNAMKHGLSARTATYFPAKPDGYAFCKTCEVDRVWCKAQAACSKKTELFMLHHAAFEQRNPKHLMGIYADQQAGLFAIVQQMMIDIANRGPMIVKPEWYTDKDGDCHLAQITGADGKVHTFTTEREHPLLRVLSEFVSKANLNMHDMGMTHRALENDEAELGKLNDGSAQREELGDYQRRQVEALEGLANVMKNAAANKMRDSVLIEHQKQNGDGA